MTVINNTPLVIGHRGASALAPENTLAAFARAFRDGADGIELDVRLSQDGVPVVIHDAMIRTQQRKRFVSRLRVEELQQIDVGTRFNRRQQQLARFEYPGETIPTLADVFALFARQAPRRSIVYVELKCGHSIKSNEDLARATLNTIHRHQMERNVVVISFNLRIVGFVKEIAPAIRTGALFGHPQAALKSPERIIAATLRSAANELLLHHRIALKRTVNAARQSNLPVVVWTVDNPKWIGRARDFGIQAIMTNNPATMFGA